MPGRGRGAGYERGKPSGRGGYRGRGSRNGAQMQPYRKPTTEVIQDPSDNQTKSHATPLMARTIDACRRQLPDYGENMPEFALTEEESQHISEILSSLSPEQQITHDFLVPLPSIESKLSVQVNIPPPNSPATQPKSDKPEDLNSWLNNLLS